MDKTKDGILIMGRICYQDFQEEAPSREVIVLTRNERISFEHAQKARCLEEAIELAEKSNKDVWICGGRKVYEEAMPHADFLYLTQIDSVFEGDVHFPSWETTFTREISRYSVRENEVDLNFLVLAKA